MNSGPLISSSAGCLIACTTPQKCPLLLPRSRNHRPPGHGSSVMRIGRPSGLTLRGPICSSSAANVFSSDARTGISWLIFSVKFSMAGSTATILPPLKCMRRTLVALGAFLDSIELIAPVAFEESGPFMERPERRGVRSIQDLPPVAAGADDADVPQHSQVLRHGGLRQLQRVDDFVYRSLVAGDE